MYFDFSLSVIKIYNARNISCSFVALTVIIGIQ